MAFAKRPSAKQMNRLRAWVGAADGGRRSVAIAYDSAVGYWCVIITDEQGRRFALTPDYAEADWDRLLAVCGERISTRQETERREAKMHMRG